MNSLDDGPRSALDVLIKQYNLIDIRERLDESKSCVGRSHKGKQRCLIGRDYGTEIRPLIERDLKILANLDPRKKPERCAEVLSGLYRLILCSYHDAGAKSLIREWEAHTTMLKQEEDDRKVELQRHRQVSSQIYHEEDSKKFTNPEALLKQSLATTSAPLTPPTSPNGAESAATNPFEIPNPIAPMDLPTPPPSTEEEQKSPPLQLPSPSSRDTPPVQSPPVTPRPAAVSNDSNDSQTTKRTVSIEFSRKGFSVSLSKSSTKKTTSDSPEATISEVTVTEVQQTNPDGSVTQALAAEEVTILSPGTGAAEVISTPEENSAPKMPDETPTKFSRNKFNLRSKTKHMRESLGKVMTTTMSMTNLPPETKDKLKAAGEKMRDAGGQILGSRGKVRGADGLAAVAQADDDGDDRGGEETGGDDETEVDSAAVATEG